MIREFLLPDLGEGLTESEVVRWHVAEGESVGQDQVLAEVETAKALVEVPSPWAGVVERLHVDEGTVVDVGAVILSVRTDEDDADSQPDGGSTASSAGRGAAAEPAEDVAPPNLVGYGAAAEPDGAPARRARRFAPRSGEPAAAATAAALDPAPAAPATAGLRTAPPVRSSPPVRHLAQRLGVVIDELTGTGERGLVTRGDVEAAVSAGTSGAGPDAAAPPTGPAPSAAPHPQDDERVPVRGVRKATAEAVLAAWQVPQVTVFTTVDATATVELLERLRGQRSGVRLTFLAAVARATCLALARHPGVNARWAGQEIVRHRAVSLGIAAATPRGLVVPVLHDVGSASLVELAEAITDLAATARAGRTTPAAMAGGTFTLSNVGVFGVETGTPLLHDGQAAILAVGALARRPWEHEGAVALRQVVTLSLTVDHRVLDGEDGARFLADLGAVLTDPATAFTG